MAGGADPGLLAACAEKDATEVEDGAQNYTFRCSEPYPTGRYVVGLACFPIHGKMPLGYQRSVYCNYA